MSPRPPAVARLPEEPGVYRFRGATGEVLYVGRAVNLRRRVGSYWGDLRGRAHLSAMVPRIARIEALVCASEHEAAWLERNILERHLPPWNRTRGGEESPVHLCLDVSATTPGLRAAHLPRSGCFGPYLGGLKVRMAVTALHRVYPLAYTGIALTAAEQEMARLRGVVPADRPRFAEALTAVLRRRRQAVRQVCAELSARRDEAAAAEAFELAARIQEELAAIAWITAPQRVTTMTATDAEFSAYAGGVRVRFEVRGGRLCDWHESPAAEPETGPAVPPRWASFAGRNAALAAALDPRMHPPGRRDGSGSG
ncbi:nucleotide excision repair endonuclease [Actinoplanes sp. CA-142083]|uniref:nucleotide excision repair endonuclease n=1 Tax=Actinoplanes sp. CA-142083 TaxID=3239903 RepID=UPI003D8CFC82